jgi:zinc protease
MAAAVISTVSDSVSIPATDDTLTVRHYILGKTWDWGAAPDYTFIESIDAFGSALDEAELIYKK